MINPQELIEKYTDEGHSCEEAVRLARIELKAKKVVVRKNNLEAANKRINESRSFLTQA